MKKPLLFSTFLFAIVYLQAAPYEYGERKGWHINLSTSAVVPSGTDFDQHTNGGAKVRGDLNLESTAGINLGTGYTFGHWRFEMEYAYKKLDSDEIIGVGLGSIDEHLRYHTFMANFAYDWFIYKKLYWYNGAGVGIALTQYDNGTSGGDDTDASFAYQLTTGFGYEVKENLDIFLGYRMFRTLDLDYEFRDNTGAHQHIRMDSPWLFQFEAGLRIRL